MTIILPMTWIDFQQYPQNMPSVSGALSSFRSNLMEGAKCIRLVVGGYNVSKSVF